MKINITKKKSSKVIFIILGGMIVSGIGVGLSFIKVNNQPVFSNEQNSLPSDTNINYHIGGHHDDDEDDEEYVLKSEYISKAELSSDYTAKTELLNYTKKSDLTEKYIPNKDITKYTSKTEVEKNYHLKSQSYSRSDLGVTTLNDQIRTGVADGVLGPNLIDSSKWITRIKLKPEEYGRKTTHYTLERTPYHPSGQFPGSYLYTDDSQQTYLNRYPTNIQQPGAKYKQNDVIKLTSQSTEYGITNRGYSLDNTVINKRVLKDDVVFSVKPFVPADGYSDPNNYYVVTNNNVKLAVTFNVNYLKKSLVKDGSLYYKNYVNYGNKKGVLPNDKQIVELKKADKSVGVHFVAIENEKYKLYQKEDETSQYRFSDPFTFYLEQGQKTTIYKIEQSDEITNVDGTKHIFVFGYKLEVNWPLNESPTMTILEKKEQKIVVEDSTKLKEEFYISTPYNNTNFTISQLPSDKSLDFNNHFNKSVEVEEVL